MWRVEGHGVEGGPVGVRVKGGGGGAVTCKSSPTPLACLTPIHLELTASQLAPPFHPPTIFTKPPPTVHDLCARWGTMTVR